LQKWHGEKETYSGERIQENCGSWKRVAVTDKELTRYTGVVWLKEKVWTHYEDNKPIKDLGGRLPLCPRKERTSSWTYRKTIDSVKIAKQKPGSYAASRKIKDWTLWKGRPPPQNEKKNPAHRAEASNVETPAPTARRRRKKSTTTTRKEVTEVYRVPPGTSKRKEGAMVVVGTGKKKGEGKKHRRGKKRRCKHRPRREEKVIHR
jgi:hypothetical protein